MTETTSKLKDGDFEMYGMIDLPQFDPTPYDGQKVDIEKVTPKNGQFGPCVLIESVVLETLGEGKNAREVRASRLFGLQTDDEGRIGWGEGTKLALFLKKYGVERPEQLIEDKVPVLAVVKVESDDRKFLTLQ